PTLRLRRLRRQVRPTSCLITLPAWFPASCGRTGRPRLTQIRACHARQLPVFASTNATFISHHQRFSLHEYFASFSWSLVQGRCPYHCSRLCSARYWLRGSLSIAHYH